MSDHGLRTLDLGQQPSPFPGRWQRAIVFREESVAVLRDPIVENVAEGAGEKQRRAGEKAPVTTGVDQGVEHGIGAKLGRTTGLEVDDCGKRFAEFRFEHFPSGFSLEWGEPQLFEAIPPHKKTH